MNQKNAQVLGSILLAIDRAMGMHTRTEATCCGVTLPQCHAIMEIGLTGKTSVKALSSALGLDKSTMSRTIDGLVESGLVERSLDIEDRRYVVVNLSEKGMEIFQRINRTWHQFCTDLMKNIPLKKHDSIIEALQLIAESIQKSGVGKKFSEMCCKPKEK